MLESAHLDNVIKVGSYHFANLFSEDKSNQVFYISSPVSIFHLSGKKNFQNTMSRLKNWIKGGKFYKENLFGYVPFTILPIYNKSIFKSKFAINNSLKFTFPNIKKILKKHNFLNVDIIILSHLLLHSTLDFVDYKFSIYRMTDDIDKFTQIPKKIKDTEEKIIKKVDAVVVTAKNLVDKVKNIEDKKNYYIPNGVDFEFFQNSKYDAPSEYYRIKEPRIIYVGAIDNWFDVELLRYCAENLNTYSFVIIGSIRIDLTKINSLKNVFVLGERDYNLIPRYLKNSHCGIIPFKNIELVQSISPIKLYEYFASGIPVVSIKSKELKNLNSPAYLASNYDEFLKFIKSAITEDIRLKEEFIKFAKENSWRKRFSKIKEIIDENINH